MFWSLHLPVTCCVLQVPNCGIQRKLRNIEINALLGGVVEGWMLGLQVPDNIQLYKPSINSTTNDNNYSK